MRKILRDRVVYEHGIYWIEGDFIKVLMKKPFDKSKMPQDLINEDTIFDVEFIDNAEYDLHINARIISTY